MNTMSVADVKFRTDLYPRIKPDPATVERYRSSLDMLPPIEVNQHGEIIDGWHRWTAYRSERRETVPVVVTETANESELLELAIRRNAVHGLQLSQEDKHRMAIRLYNGAAPAEKKPLKARLPEILSVSSKSVERWLADIVKTDKRKLRDQALDLFLRCYSERQISEALGITRDDLRGLNLVEIGQLSEIHQSAAVYAGEEWFPYNVWAAREKTNSVSHPGNSEPAWTDRLVRAYTDPFDVVIDPFGGGGATLDVCRKRVRRCLISDLAPIPAREHEIRQHDVTTGALKPPQWKDVRLVFLDPPYWRQKEYGGGPTDLSAMDASAFHNALAAVIDGYADKVPAGCRIALMLQPTQWKAPEKAFIDHTAEMLRRVALPVEQRIQAPYATQQCQPQMVEWAKKELQWLVLSREIVVWRKP